MLLHNSVGAKRTLGSASWHAAAILHFPMRAVRCTATALWDATELLLLAVDALHARHRDALAGCGARARSGELWLQKNGCGDTIWGCLQLLESLEL